jgi:hypothetical protein
MHSVVWSSKCRDRIAVAVPLRAASRAGGPGLVVDLSLSPLLWPGVQGVSCDDAAEVRGRRCADGVGVERSAQHRRDGRSGSAVAPAAGDQPACQLRRPGRYHRLLSGQRWRVPGGRAGRSSRRHGRDPPVRAAAGGGLAGTGASRGPPPWGRTGTDGGFGAACWATRPARTAPGHGDEPAKRWPSTGASAIRKWAGNTGPAGRGPWSTTPRCSEVLLSSHSAWV